MKAVPKARLLLPQRSRHLAITRRVHLCTCEVDVEPLVDTVDQDQCRALGVHDFDLACPVWESEMLASGVAVPQNLADHLIAVGYAGMRARSFAARPGSANPNLVVWRSRARLRHRVILAKENSP